MAPISSSLSNTNTSTLNGHFFPPLSPPPVLLPSSSISSSSSSFSSSSPSPLLLHLLLFLLLSCLFSCFYLFRPSLAFFLCMQHPTTANFSKTPRAPKSHLKLSCLAMLCCCCPIGFLAFIDSCKVCSN